MRFSSIMETIVAMGEVMDEPSCKEPRGWVNEGKLERFRAGKTYTYRLVTKKRKRGD